MASTVHPYVMHHQMFDTRARRAFVSPHCARDAPTVHSSTRWRARNDIVNCHKRPHAIFAVEKRIPRLNKIAHCLIPPPVSAFSNVLSVIHALFQNTNKHFTTTSKKMKILRMLAEERERTEFFAVSQPWHRHRNAKYHCLK